MFVKICGTTNEEDALLSVALGADALGFIFAPSKRQVTATQASDIIKRLPPEVLSVGVFRNETTERLIRIVLDTGVRAVQLHGMESPQQLEEIRKQLPLVMIKAFAAGSKEMQRAQDYNADVVFLDAPTPGSGHVFDWRLVEGIPDGTRLMLAGGLTPENVTEAIETVRPWAVDVATGVEQRPGRKDPVKLRAFIANAKAAVVPTTRVIDRSSDSHAVRPFDWRED